MNLYIIDTNTGEKIPINSQSVTEYINNLTPIQKAELLTKVNFIKRVTIKMDKLIKDFAKKNTTLTDGHGDFFGHNITEYPKLAFNKKLFEENATNLEKSIVDDAEKIKQKYSTTKNIIKM